MKKIILLCVTCLSSMVYADTKTAAEYERQSHACYSVFDGSDSETLRCLSNTHNQTKAAIQERLTALKNRDKVHVLNTKILQLNILGQSCHSKFLNSASIKSCILNSDLSALHYLELRYE